MTASKKAKMTIEDIDEDDDDTDDEVCFVTCELNPVNKLAVYFTASCLC